MTLRVAPAADVIGDTILVRSAAAGPVIDVTGDAPIPPGLLRGRVQPLDISGPRRSALERYAGSRPPREPPGDGLSEPPGSRFSPYRARSVSPAGPGGQHAIISPPAPEVMPMGTSLALTTPGRQSAPTSTRICRIAGVASLDVYASSCMSPGAASVVGSSSSPKFEARLPTSAAPARSQSHVNSQG
jgi:hypothetical protein